MNLRRLFGLCEHRWPGWRLRPAQLGFVLAREYVRECTLCGLEQKQASTGDAPPPLLFWPRARGK